MNRNEVIVHSQALSKLNNLSFFVGSMQSIQIHELKA
ncbi:hypothetical protein HNP68_001050 [Borrelia yangtzensis]|uniref:Uncharacterized protein n=1 Tax=Borreliella yangtzensis TaxID=683292 RepID=A0ABR6PAX1_9SPIR|nr:hypothetical protein [Borreliella yangtzensis]